MTRLTCLLAALLLPTVAVAQPAAGRPAVAPGLPIQAPTHDAVYAPISAIWSGEWKAVDFNLPTATANLSTRRDTASLQVTALIANAKCPMRYDGLLASADIVRRIEERALWQLDAANWPAGTDTTQLVGLRTEFDAALRVARSLPSDSYRRVRASCPGRPSKDDRFYLLSGGRRLYEFQFPDQGLGVSATLYQRTR